MHHTFSIASPRPRLAAVALACSAAFAAQAKPLYHVEAADPSGTVWLQAINAAGTSAGSVTPVGGLPLAAVGTAGSYHDADANVADTVVSYAVGINASGVSVGQARYDGIYEVPVMWDAAGHRTLLELPEGEETVVTGINDDGTICGYANIIGAVIWKNGGKPKAIAEIINGFGYPSAAYAINQKGWVTGGLPDDNGLLHPFIYKDGQATNLGGLGVNSYGTSINAKGHIAGTANFDTVSGTRHPIWYDGTAWHDLAGLGGKKGAMANGINAHDVIVGSSSIKGQREYRAFVYMHGNMYQLDKRLDATSDPGWQLDDATAINDDGVIVGQGTLNGVMQGYIATPVRK